MSIFRTRIHVRPYSFLSSFISTLLCMLCAYSTAPCEQTAQFTLSTMDGKYIQSDDLLKKGPVLIAFWAIWCKDCKNELQALDSVLPEDIRARATIVAVTIDTPRSIMLAKSYITARKMRFLFCTDPNSELLRQFGGKAIPYTVLLDGDRNVALRHIGYSPGDEKRILDLLRVYSSATNTGKPEPSENKR